MKELLLGNEAVARGLYEAGCQVVSSYPGTPSTEITEAVSKYDEIYSEWAPNEKVSAEVAIGASIVGARSFCAMKHVGLNVAADPLYTASYTGVLGGMVVAVADDPGMHSSQNEQDSRHHAIASKLPMLEPSDSAECCEFTKMAFDLSEQFDTPIFIRLTTRISHSRSMVETCPRTEHPLKEYVKNPAKNVMMPAMARGRHVFVEQRMKDITQYCETSKLNVVTNNDGAKIGVITSGIAYQYALEALGEKASYCKLGIVNPLPKQLVIDFASKFEQVIIIEELDGIIEQHCKALGINCIGKDLFSNIGELSQQIIRDAVLHQKPNNYTFEDTTPSRPPVLCAGCPHRGVFYVLKKLGLVVSGDIGCYTLGALAPLNGMDSCICMGASVSALHGMNVTRGPEFAHKSIAVIGDSTFMHSGITGLIDITYNQGISTVLILDNSITGMTGHQENPTTGKTIKGRDTISINLEALVKACGIEHVVVVDPHDMAKTEQVICEELNRDAASVIIVRRPCVLLKYVKANDGLGVSNNICTGCADCQLIGCPAISIHNEKAVIDQTQCVGCALCQQMCPYAAILPKEAL